MPRISGLPALLSLLLILPVDLSAQAGSPPAKHALIRKVLQLTQAAEQALSVMEKAVEGQRTMNPEIPAVFWDRFMARARERKGELIDLLVPVYDEAFSLEDLQGLVEFYRSPVGRRFIEAQPAVIQASMEAGERWGTRLGAEVGKEIQKEGANLN